MKALLWWRRAIKACERLVRACAVRMVASLLAARPRPATLVEHRPLRFLIIRLDRRLGNVLMTTPLFSSLRARYPDAAIDVAVHPYAARVLRDHPAMLRLLPVERRSLFGTAGIWRRLRAMRRQGYDVCIDATNPTDPSVTQALLCRAAGATFRIGHAVAPFASLYTARVPVTPRASATWHEVDCRLSLLSPLGEGPVITRTCVGPLKDAARPPMVAFVEAMHGKRLCVINLGARATARRVSAADGATVANICKSVGLCPVLVAGRDEGALCEEVQRLSLDVLVAPDADLNDLALLFDHACAFVSGDTGPMHLGVAMQCPTLAIFSVTDPTRYGYQQAPHAVIDARGLASEHWAPLVRQYLTGIVSSARPATDKQPRHPLLHAARKAHASADARTSPLGMP